MMRPCRPGHQDRVRILVGPDRGPESVPLLSGSCPTGWWLVNSGGPVLITERLERLSHRYFRRG